MRSMVSCSLHWRTTYYYQILTPSVKRDIAHLCRDASPHTVRGRHDHDHPEGHHTADSESALSLTLDPGSTSSTASISQLQGAPPPSSSSSSIVFPRQPSFDSQLGIATRPDLGVSIQTFDGVPGAGEGSLQSQGQYQDTQSQQPQSQAPLQPLTQQLQPSQPPQLFNDPTFPNPWPLLDSTSNQGQDTSLPLPYNPDLSGGIGNGASTNSDTAGFTLFPNGADNSGMNWNMNDESELGALS